MPRELADVLHYFLPEAGDPPRPDAAGGPGGTAPSRRGVSTRSLAALPLVAVPIGDRDLVRAAFTWNLCVEVARLGGRAVLVAPACERDAALWPGAGVGPLGSEVVLTDAGELGALYRTALDVAVERADDADPEVGGVVLVRVPPLWLPGASDGARLLRWSLLFSTGDARDILETYGIAKLLMAIDAEARVGVTLHGIRRVAEAEVAFGRLARTAEEHLGRGLTSYGALLDDLHVYRAIVARRPIGLEHPQSPAAKALRDVASLLLDDALESTDA